MRGDGIERAGLPRVGNQRRMMTPGFGLLALTIAGLVLSKSVGVGSDMVPGRDISSMMPGD
ncbi:hypothetical protein DD568_31055, partial [Klebsiella pneumoniae]